MASVSPADVIRFRSPIHTTSVVVNAVPKTVIATAQVNQATFTFPLVQLTVDNGVTLTNAKIGHLVWVGTAPGTNNVLTGVLRRNSLSNGASGTLYIDAKGQGDPGLPIDIVNGLADNLYVTIIKFRPPWGLLSSIRNGIFYKQWDVLYAGQNATPEPIVRLGKWQAAFVDSGTGLATFTLTADVYGWGSAVASYSWFIDGATLTGGSLTGSSVTFTCPPGFYEITCAVRLANGRTHTAVRYVWSNTTDPSLDTSPFNYRHITRIVSDNQVVNGRTMTLEFDGTVTTSEVFQEQAFLVTETPLFDYESLDDPSVFVSNFVGYRKNNDISATPYLLTTSANLEGPLIRARSLVAATQQLVEQTSPANWAQCSQVLSNPVGAIFYICNWHAPRLIDLHDFTFETALLSLRRKAIQFGSTDIGSQLESIGDLFSGSVGCRSDGTLTAFRNPMLLSNTDRNAMIVKYLWEPEDVDGKIEQPETQVMQTAQVFGSAFSYDGTTSTPYQSLAPGYTKSQGLNVSQMTPFTVKASDGQSKVNEITGHQFALENRRSQDSSVAINRNIDIVEPCNLNEWHTFNIPTDFDPEEVGWPNIRTIPTRVSRSWSQDGETTKHISMDVQTESFGIAGVTVPINRGGANAYPTNQWTPGVTSSPYQPAMPNLGLTIPVMLAWNDLGKLARTFTFTSQNLHWQSMNKLTNFPTGDVIDVCLDFSSPYFGDPALSLNAFALINNGGTLKLWKITGISATTPTYTNVATASWTAGTGFAGRGRVVASRELTSLILVVWSNSSGIRWARSTNTGSTFSAAAQMGSSIGTNEDPSKPIGIAVYNAFQCVLAPTGSVDVDGAYIHQPYYATTAAGAFSLASGIPAGYRAILGELFASKETEVFVPMENPASVAPANPLDVVTFNSSGYTGYPTYVISRSAGTNLSVPGSVQYQGDYIDPYPMPIINAGNSAGSQNSNSHTTQSINVFVDVDLGAEYDFSSLSYDRCIPSLNTTPRYLNTTHEVIIEFFDKDGFSVGSVITEYTQIADTAIAGFGTGSNIVFNENTDYSPYVNGISPPNGNYVADIATGNAMTEAQIKDGAWQFWMEHFNTVTLTAEKAKLTGLVKSFRISYYHSWTYVSGSHISDCHLDNLVFNGTLVNNAHTTKLYYADPVGGTWTDVTPESNTIPNQSYGIASSYVASPAEATDYSMITVNDNLYSRIWSTVNKGVDWTRGANAIWTGLKRASQMLILFGYNNMSLSPDLGTTIYQRNGDWSTVIGTISEIRGMTGIF